MQIKAATKVNREMLIFYWSLGKDIVELKSENKWGSGFLKNLSQDLTDALPNQHSFSPTNLGYMRRFYLLYMKICPQVGLIFLKNQSKCIYFLHFVCYINGEIEVEYG